MAWDFQQMINYGRQFNNNPNGTELAFVFSAITPEKKLNLATVYPSVLETIDPEAPLPDVQIMRWAGYRNGAWESVKAVLDAAGFETYGLFTPGVLLSGVGSNMSTATWAAKGIGAGYIIAPGSTLDQINSDRTTGLALIRTYVNESDGEVQPLAPDEPFTSGQVTALSTWLNAHGVTTQEFAELFDITAAQLSIWLQNHARWEMAKQVSERFGS